MVLEKNIRSVVGQNMINFFIFFLPVTLLIFLFFLFSLPLLFLLSWFHLITFGFEKLGISPQLTIFLLFTSLICSTINIPVIQKKFFYIEKRFFGFFQIPKVETEGIAINVGGAIIPLLLSFYFLISALKLRVDLKPILISTFLMILVCKFLAKVIPGVGISLPALIPPIFSALFSFIFSPGFAAPAAYIAGTFGVLIGADLLNLKNARKYGGFLSIGGAGVFDGIFLVGIISVLLVS